MGSVALGIWPNDGVLGRPDARRTRRSIAPAKWTGASTADRRDWASCQLGAQRSFGDGDSATVERPLLLACHLSTQAGGCAQVSVDLKFGR